MNVPIENDGKRNVVPGIGSVAASPTECEGAESDCERGKVAASRILEHIQGGKFSLILLGINATKEDIAFIRIYSPYGQ